MQKPKPLKHKNGVRDSSGLTEKQRRSIPVISKAISVHAGARECVEMGIMCSIDYFYQRWWREPVYVKALTEERDRLLGEVGDRVRRLFLASIEGTAANVIKAAQSSRGDAMRAAEIHFAVVGIDTGRGTRFYQHQNITQNTGDGLKTLSDADLRKMLQREVSALEESGIGENRLRDNNYKGAKRN